MKMRTLCIGITIAAAVLMLSGCSHRIGVGSDVPREQLVVVKVSKFGGAPLCVVAVDGKNLFWIPSRTDKMLLAPGQHELEIKLFENRRNERGISVTLYSPNSKFRTFFGEAGHHYRIVGEGSGSDYEVWIEDETLGK
jgi:hypothetical protein